MDYDFRTRSGASYDPQGPMYRTASSSAPSPHPMYGPSLYPRVGQPQPGHTVVPSAANRPSSYHHHTTTSSSSSSSSSCKSNSVPKSSSTFPHSYIYLFFFGNFAAGLGIRVMIKPQYRITPPPQLSPQVGDIPRSNFQFDFDFERKVLAEAEKESQNWSRLGMENVPPRTTESTSSTGSVADPVVSKYISMGLSRDAVPLAVANYGDDPTKVRDFVNGYTLLREMGFSSSNVAEALVVYENDTDKALAHFLNSSS